MIHTTMRSRRSADALRKKKAKELKKQGEEEMAAGDYEKATATLLDALHADPYNRAIAAEEAEAAKKAKAAELKKEADEMMADGDYADAARTYGTAAGLDPSMTVFQR